MKVRNRRCSARVAALAMAAVLVMAAIVTILATQWASAGSSDAKEVLAQAMSGLSERGVPVESWSLEESRLNVALRSESTTKVGAPDDPINLSLVQREAFLAKSRGLDLVSLRLEVTNANGESLFLGETVLDTELHPDWSKERALGEAETVEAVRTALNEKADLSGLSLGSMELVSKTGAREIHLTAVAADARSAGVSTASFMICLYNAVNETNTLRNGQIALAFVDITDKAGEPLLRWVYDAQRGAQDWWQAPGMTTDWFETPGPVGLLPATRGV